MSSISQHFAAAHGHFVIYLVDVEHKLVNTLWMTKATTYTQFMGKLNTARLRQAARLFPHAVLEPGPIIPPDNWQFRIVAKGALKGRFAATNVPWEALTREREFSALKQRLWGRADIEVHVRQHVVDPRVVRQSDTSSSAAATASASILLPPTTLIISAPPAAAAAAAPVDFRIWEQSNYPPLVINGANVRPEPESDKQ